MNTIIYGRNLIVNVRKFIEFQLTVNLSIIMIIIVTSCLNKDCPFTILQLMIINLLMDTGGAIMLAFQNPRETNTKLQFEINKKDAIVTTLMLVKIILHATLIAGISLYIYYFSHEFLSITLAVKSSSIETFKPMISGSKFNLDGTPNF